MTTIKTIQQKNTKTTIGEKSCIASMARCLLISALALFMLPSTLLAQNPKWFKKARKAQLTVIAYDNQGNMKQGQGYFVNETGDAVTEYDILKNATRAVVVDADGKEYNVTSILGASSIYNVAKMSTSCDKAKPMPMAKQTAQKGERIYVMPICSNDSKALCKEDVIENIQEFDDAKYPYYTLHNPINERYAGCPVFNENGELLGHIQLSAGGADNPAYALGVLYQESLQIKALDVNNHDLKAIGIVKALPEDESQATSYILLYSKQNPTEYKEVIKMYISKFPTSHTGYIQMGELLTSQKEYKAAEEAYAQGLKIQTGHDDEIHHSLAKMMYQTSLQDSSAIDGWNMERALQEATAAYSANPLPLYTALEGMCLYSLKKYEEAYQKFMQVTTTNMRSAEYFSYAQLCKSKMNATDEEILALQDSCVNCYTKPYPTEAVKYLYPRAKTLAKLKRYREAVNDMNECEHLLSGNVNSTFYFEREQMEIQCRMYPAALSDIERAANLSPDDPSLRAEEAALNYRVGQLDEAIVIARKAIAIDPEYPDPYRILGVALRDKGKTAEAKEALKKSVELGDTLAPSILEKMK